MPADRDVTIQRRFTDLISGEESPDASRGQLIYQKLLFRRFEEVIENAFVRLKALIDPDEWRELISGFIRHGAATPYIWQLPGEFRRYAGKHISLPFAKDLMWFEWSEIELMMQPTAPKKESLLAWDAPTALSTTARLKRLCYPVHETKNDDRLPTMERGDYPILLYRSAYNDAVILLPLTLFMYQVFEHLEKGASPEAAVRQVAEAYGESYDDAAVIIHPVLEEFYRLGILV